MNIDALFRRPIRLFAIVKLRAEYFKEFEYFGLEHEVLIFENKTNLQIHQNIALDIIQDIFYQDFSYS